MNEERQQQQQQRRKSQRRRQGERESFSSFRYNFELAAVECAIAAEEAAAGVDATAILRRWHKCYPPRTPPSSSQRYSKRSSKNKIC